MTLTASERALYLELEHYLRAQELKMKKTGKSQSDRVRRLNKALGESKYVVHIYSFHLIDDFTERRKKPCSKAHHISIVRPSTSSILQSHAISS